VQLAATKALSQLAGGGPELAQRLCAEPGLMPALTALMMTRATPAALRTAISTCLTNMCRSVEGVPSGDALNQP
jgi:hypothetical protein